MFLPWKNYAFIQQFCSITQSKPQQTSMIEFKCKENGWEMDSRIRTCSQLYKMATKYFICIRILVNIHSHLSLGQMGNSANTPEGCWFAHQT